DIEGDAVHIDLIPLAGDNKIFRISSDSNAIILGNPTLGQDQINFIDNINGYGVGDNGLFLRTTDGGNTWSKSFIAQNPIILTKIQFINQSTGFITAANYGKKIGYIFKTIDGGSNWNVATVDTSGVLLDIYMISTDTGYAIGHEKVFKTTNGGNTGINDDKPDNIFDIKIYPNPTSSQINIQLKNLENQDVELTIMNILGEVIYEEMFHNVEGELNKIYALSQLSNGIYFIKIGLDERIFVNKIIIQK
ncbi:MAG: T9SS type A sorting domain-containing protein, partial [Bacteroidetes bacterium]|nr:T9SS type A sorting domain-containing protein [Bacteroidota bacterium]